MLLKNIARSLVYSIHHHLLGWLLGTYILAACLPGPGQMLRHIVLGQLSIPGTGPVALSMPLCMLSLLLFNAGLGAKTSELLNLRHQPLPLLLGLLANLLLPLVFSLLLLAAIHTWHNAAELQYLLMGLAIIASMPIAGSSTAWSQNVNGNMALSLGLVVFSTLLSPLTTPWILRAFGLLTQGDYSSDLQELALTGVNGFLMISVVLPSLLGMVLRPAIIRIGGERAFNYIKPWLQGINALNILVLSYSNASVALPQVFLKPDWDFLGLIALSTIVLCSLAFITGWGVASLLKTASEDRHALMYGLGMNNNGTGLVLSGSALADHPTVMIPILFYNIVQQVIAGIVNAWLSRKVPGSS